MMLSILPNRGCREKMRGLDITSTSVMGYLFAGNSLEIDYYYDIYADIILHLFTFICKSVI
jgi:hypothetical protein